MRDKNLIPIRRKRGCVQPAFAILNVTTQGRRLACAAVFVLLTCSHATAQSESSKFPYQALVGRENAIVRSGPGEVHYGTQRLQPGDVVEVYRHDPGGWYAIQPPKGSFSLIPESAVEIVRDNIGEILVEGTRPWVGTRLDPVEKPLWQVKLHEGEKVALLGELSWPSAEGFSTIWYQIKPPAGELRWIHRDQLQRLTDELPSEPIGYSEPTLDSSSTQAPPQKIAADRKYSAPTPPQDVMLTEGTAIGAGLRTSPPIPLPQTRPQPTEVANANWETQSLIPDDASAATARPATEIQLASFEPSPTPPQSKVQGPQDQSGINAGWRRSRRAMSDSGVADYPARDLVTAPQQSLQSSTGSLDRVDGSDRFSPSPRVAANTWDRETMALQLSQSRDREPSFLNDPTQPLPSNLAALESILTREMLKPDPSQWNLTPLEQAADLLVDSGNPNDRNQALRILEKIRGCQRLQQGFSQTNPSGQPATFASNPNNGFANGTGDPQPDGDRQFDAVGWLNQLTRQHGTLPTTYVLQDETGKITHLIEPIPGLNLQRYLRQKIGVKGKRGYHQELELKHVLVERAYPL